MSSGGGDENINVNIQKLMLKRICCIDPKWQIIKC